MHAQNLTGDWQGALTVGTQELRLIVHFEQGQPGSWKATLASIDQGPDRGTALPASAVTVQQTAITLAFPAIRSTFTGTIGPDGNSIAGTWTQGQPLPLELRRVIHRVAAADLDVRMRPDAEAAPDSSAAYTLAKSFGEDHRGSVTPLWLER